MYLPPEEICIFHQKEYFDILFLDVTFLRTSNIQRVQWYPSKTYLGIKWEKISKLSFYTEKNFWIRLSGKVNNIISTRVRIYNFHLIWNLFFIYNQLMWHNVNPIYRKYFCGTIHINKRKPGGRFKPNDTIQSSQILPLHHCCYLNS